MIGILSFKMKYERNSISVSVFLIMSALFLSYSDNASSSIEVDDERSFDYLKEGGKGPNNWGDLNPEWAACKKGEFQSPIDMTNDRVTVVQGPGDVSMKYKPGQAIIKNRGHDISLQWPKFDAGCLAINGTDYVLHQAHWHSPSEHTINGKSYALELHLVHDFIDAQKKETIAVLGQLYDYGAPNHFVSMLVSNITDMIKNEKVLESPVWSKDPNQMMALPDGYFRYIGSLTVPPCTEGVIWTISKKIATVSKEQVQVMRQAVHDYAEKNARPVQPLHDRKIYLYGAKDSKF